MQMAIKYTHLKDVYRDYRESILQKFTISVPHPFSMTLMLMAKPVIAHGRFILMSTFKSFKALSHTTIKICPHLGVEKLVEPDNPLLRTIRCAFDATYSWSGLNQAFQSYDHCPTDFLALIRGLSVMLGVWQDLRTGISPADPYWRSHIWNVKENDQFHGIKFSYKHGSVRDLFFTSHT